MKKLLLIFLSIAGLAAAQTQINSTPNPVTALVLPALTVPLSAVPVTMQCLTVLTDGTQSTPALLAVWSSSNPAVATIVSGLNGVATIGLVAAGTTTISCFMSGKTGSNTLTVTATPTITAPSCGTPPCALPGGSNGAAYTSSLAATGGVLPYTWTCPTTCSKPAWLSINASTGALTGTAATGSTTFTIQVCDSTSPTPSCNTLSVTLAVTSSCGPPTYSCSRTDTSPLSYAASLVPPQMGANSCSAGSLAACGNLVGAGTLVNDPFLSNPVMRLTDNTTSRADQPNVTNVADISGSGDEMHFSCDSSMVTVGSINSWAFPMNFTWGSAPTKMYATSFGNGGLYFSGANGGMAWGHVCPSNANVLYILNGTVLGHYNLAGNCPTCTAPSVVTDFDFASSANCLGTYTSTWADFGGGDQFDTDYAVGFSKTGGQGTGTKLAVWRKGFGCRVLDTSTDTVTGDWGPTGVIPGTPCTGTIHNDKIAKVGGSAGSVLWAITGASAGCGTSAATQPWQWNYASSTLTGSISSACTGVHCSGHWTEGLSTFANNPGDVAPNALTVRPLTTPGTGTGITPVYPVVAPTDSHFGWNQLIDSQPFLGTFSRFTGLPPVAAWENEVVGFQPISSGKQYRFASTYNTGVSPYFSTQYAIGSVSQDGKYFIFSSDWMNTLGSISGGSTCVPHGPNWAASTVYAATPYLSSFPANGGVIKPTSGNAGGYSYKASTAGTSGLAPPTWPQTVGGTVADGSTLVWTNVDAEGTTKACRGDVFVVLLQ